MACDRDWATQADVERAVMTFVVNTFATTVAESTVRRYTRMFMDEWLAQKDRK
jgi:hypothetical protein